MRAGTAAGLLEREPLAAHDVLRLRLRIAAQRQARVDGQIGRRRRRRQRERSGEQQREGAARAQNVYRFFGQPSFGLPMPALYGKQLA